MVRSEPIHVANKSGKMLTLPLSNATNRTRIGSEIAKKKHVEIVPELRITLYIHTDRKCVLNTKYPVPRPGPGCKKSNSFAGKTKAELGRLGDEDGTE